MRSSLFVFLFTLSTSAQVVMSSNGTVFGPAVTGKPYSGEQVTETIQTLSDGTHIDRKSSAKTYRDSQGRTRTEISMKQGANEQNSLVLITIIDPVAKVNYTFDTQSKVVHRMSGPLAGAIPPPPPPPPPPQTSMAGIPAESGPPQKSETLAPQIMDGIPVEGHRTTFTYPVGSVGNDREFVTTFETWRSRELNITVLTKSSDPRSGDRITKWVNLTREEPDPSLFQPPAGYSITDNDKAEIIFDRNH